jgi:hypothetical protein
MRYDIRCIVYQIPYFLSRARWCVSFAVQEGAEVRENSRTEIQGNGPGAMESFYKGLRRTSITRLPPGDAAITDILTITPSHAALHLVQGAAASAACEGRESFGSDARNLLHRAAQMRHLMVRGLGDVESPHPVG